MISARRIPQASASPAPPRSPGMSEWKGLEGGSGRGHCLRGRGSIHLHQAALPPLSGGTCYFWKKGEGSRSQLDRKEAPRAWRLCGSRVGLWAPTSVAPTSDLQPPRMSKTEVETPWEGFGFW